jgi:hypothetical protein
MGFKRPPGRLGSLYFSKVKPRMKIFILLGDEFDGKNYEWMYFKFWLLPLL